MTNSADQGDQRAVHDQAADWFVRLQSDAAADTDWAEFEAWLAADPAHLSAYDSVEALWVLLDDSDGSLRTSLKAANDGLPRQDMTRLSLRGKRQPWAVAITALAASVAIVIGGVAYWSQRPAETVVYQTARGPGRVVSLEDGTRLHLNTRSTVTVRLDRDARRVEMADAEAAFDVAKDARRPFLITVGDRQIRVVGTEFNVLHHSGRLVLTVRRGIVEVRPLGADGGEPLRLVKGSQLTHHEGGGDSVQSVEPDAAFAWQSGYLVYADQALADVAADLSRYLPTPVRVDDGQIASLRFSGVLQLDDESAMLRRLEAYLPVTAHQESGAIILRGRRPAGLSKRQ
jgi:transmembrane sensor